MISNESIENICIFFLKFIFLILFSYIPFNNIEFEILSRRIPIKNEFNYTNLYSIYSLLNHNMSQKTVLIFEPFEYHYECSPGFSKYFIDLGYDVDIIMHISGLSSFCLFEYIDKIKFFIYNKIEEIEKFATYLSLKLVNYKYLLIETANPNLFLLYKSLKLLTINHSFFVFHHLEYLTSLSFDIPI